MGGEVKRLHADTVEMHADGCLVLWDDYAALLARVEAAERDAGRYRSWRLLAVSGTMSDAVCEMMISARTETDVDAAIDRAMQDDGRVD